jgi:hypothetical protein
LHHHRLARFTAAALIAATTGWGACSPALADAAALAPHRGVYDLSLKRADDKSSITGAQGRMVIEVKGGTCEGWTIDFRMVNQFTTENGSRLLDVRSSTYESLDGREMRYNERQFVDNRLEEETSLSASLGADGKPGTGAMEKPDSRSFEVPAGAMFSVAHQMRLVNAARRGEARDENVVFDGSDGDKSMQVISFFGPKGVAGTGSPKPLSGLAVWPVSVTYYGLGPAGTNETPDYQVQMQLYDNGVSGDLTLDYGDFALEAHLTRVDLIDPPKCP